MNITRESLKSKLTVLPALLACASLVVYVGSLSVDAHSAPAEASTTTTSATLAPPANPGIGHIASNPVTKPALHQVRVNDNPPKNLQTDVTSGPTATTTPGMPPEPVEQQRNIPGPETEANPDADEHMPVGEDYDPPPPPLPGSDLGTAWLYRGTLERWQPNLSTYNACPLAVSRRN